MADIEHRDLTGADLHEPKGVSSATSGQVYVANGAGSGSWSSVPTDNAVGEIYSATDETISVLVAGTYYRWSPTNDGTSDVSQNVTVAATSGTFTITSAGIYRVSFHGTVRDDTDEGEPVRIKFRLDGVEQDPYQEVEPIYIDKPGRVHVSKFVDASATDTVDVVMTTPNNTNNITVSNGVLQIEKIG